MAAWFIVSHRMGAKSCRQCVTADEYTSTIGDCDVRSNVLQDVKGENNEHVLLIPLVMGTSLTIY